MLKLFFKADKGLDVATRWAALFGVLTAAFAWLTKNVSWFGHLNWAAAVMLAVAFTLVALLVSSLSLAVGAYGFRVLRPVEQTPTDAIKGFAVHYDDGALQSQVDDMARTVRAVIDDYQRMSASVARFQGDLNGLKEAFQSENNKAAAARQVIERKANEALLLVPKVEKIRMDTEVCTRDLKALSQMHVEEKGRRQAAFAALCNRESLGGLRESIRKDASSLYDRLKSGEVYNNEKWQQWENVHGRWLKTINEWLDQATRYDLAVKERTLTIDDAKYELDWSIPDSQFPNAGAVRRFRKFRIIQQQWEAVVPGVEDGMKNVAFWGMTELDVRHGRPAS